MVAQCVLEHLHYTKYHTHKINELTKQPRLSGYYTEKAMVELVVTIVASKKSCKPSCFFKE